MKDVHIGGQAADGQGGDAALSGDSSAVGISHSTVITSVDQASGETTLYEDDDGSFKPSAKRLAMELTAHRASALREAVGLSPDAAVPERLPDV